MDTRTINHIISETAKNISNIDPGTVITHMNMSEFFGMSKLENKDRYYSMVSKLNKELQTAYGLFLRTEYKIGYAIALPGEEIELCEGEFNAGKKKMWKATARTNLIRIDKINDTTKKEQTIKRAQKMANLIGMIKASQENKLIGQ